MVEQVGSAQGGEGGVVGFEEIFVEVMDIVSQDEGFSYPRVSRQQHDSTTAFDVVESGCGFFEGFCLEHVLSLEVLIKGEVF